MLQARVTSKLNAVVTVLQALSKMDESCSIISVAGPLEVTGTRVLYLLSDITRQKYPTKFLEPFCASQ